MESHASINDLKKQLEVVDDDHLAKIYSEAKRDIEHHFDALFKSVLERKETLLKSLECSFAFLKAKMIEEQTQRKSKLENAAKTLEVGLSMLTINQDSAQSLLKSIIHQQQELKLQVTLPDSLIINIRGHGSIFSQPLQCQQVITLAGSLEGCFDGVGEVAKFSGPRGIAFNLDDKCLYVCDLYNNMIRKVTLAGEVSAFCKVSYPFAIAYNQNQKVFYVSSVDTHTIHQISSEGIASICAGVEGKRGHSDGIKLDAFFNLPTGIAINSQTNDLYVSDNGSHTIRKISKGVVSTLAGSNNTKGHLDGMREKAQFNNPRGLIYHEKEQALIVCDQANDCLRRISMDGNVTTLHKFPSPRFIELLTDDIALVSSLTNRIFKIELNDVNKVEVFAGKEEKGNKDGPALESQFNYPNGLTFDNLTNMCYVVDHFNHRIRQLSII